MGQQTAGFMCERFECLLIPVMLKDLTLTLCSRCGTSRRVREMAWCCSVNRRQSHMRNHFIWTSTNRPQCVLHVCSVLFFGRPRSDGWSHHGRTFSIYLCPLSVWLTLPRGVLSTSWCCPSRPCVAFLTCLCVCTHFNSSRPSSQRWDLFPLWDL